MTLRKLAPLILLSGCAHEIALPARVDVCSTLAPIVARVADKLNGPSAGPPAAFTVGGVPVYLRPSTPELERHEEVHVQQQKRLGASFYPIYVLYHHRFGYDANPLEVEAREAE